MADEAQDPTPGGHGPGDSNMGMRERADDGPDGKLYPVAVALRATFDADNHATLSRDVRTTTQRWRNVPGESESLRSIPRHRIGLVLDDDRPDRECQFLGLGRPPPAHAAPPAIAFTIAPCFFTGRGGGRHSGSG